MNLSDDDLREIFGLFSSATLHEMRATYDARDDDYFGRIDLSAEYDLTEETAEYARDAWRAVIYFLRVRGFRLEKDGVIHDLSFIDELFLK